MKKIKMVFVSILLVVAFLVGCAPDQKIYNDPKETDRSVNDGMFTTIYNDGFVLVYVDTRTGVQYFRVSNAGVAVIVDQEGKPLIYGGE